MSHDIETPDRFSEVVREKLADHELLPEQALWPQIEARLDAQKRRKALFLRISISTIGAAAMLLLAFLLFLNPKINLQQPAIMADQGSEPTSKPIVSHNPAVSLDSSDALAAVSPFQMPKKKAALQKNRLPSHDFKTGNEAPFDETIAAEQSHAPSPERKGGEPKQSNRRQEGDKRPPIANLPEPEMGDNNPAASGQRKQTSDSWSLALNVSPSNGGSGSGNTTGWSDFSAKGFDANFPSRGEELIRNEYDIMHFAPPVSFGFSVRKRLYKRLSIESGVVYTYLQTDLSSSLNDAITGRLQLHYLGIPLNLSVAIWSNPQWNIYYSAGGMVEKGVAATARESYMGTSLTKNSAIDGVQWSAQTAFGATYNFIPNLGFYIEPKVSYFFDNAQPISIRTENPVVFTIYFGLRYNF